MRIAFDVDGVLAEFTESFTSVAQQLGLTDKVWSSGDQAAWNFDFDAGPVWEAVKRSYNWWMTLWPMIDARGVVALNKVIALNDVFFVTSRVRTKGFTAEKQTELWLSSIGVNAHQTTVIATQAGKKGTLCKSLDVDMMIEDNGDNLRDLQHEGIVAVARTWQYNQHWTGLRVNTVEDFCLKYALLAQSAMQ